MPSSARCGPTSTKPRRHEKEKAAGRRLFHLMAGNAPLQWRAPSKIMRGRSVGGVGRRDRLALMQFVAGVAAGFRGRQVVALLELRHQLLLALHHPLAEPFHVEAGLLGLRENALGAL